MTLSIHMCTSLIHMCGAMHPCVRTIHLHVHIFYLYVYIIRLYVSIIDLLFIYFIFIIIICVHRAYTCTPHSPIRAHTSIHVCGIIHSYVPIILTYVHLIHPYVYMILHVWVNIHSNMHIILNYGEGFWVGVAGNRRGCFIIHMRRHLYRSICTV